MTKKKSEAEEPATVVAATGEPVDDSPYASGTVSASALKVGARDNDHVRRLQYALNKANPGQIRPTGNFQTRTTALVTEAVSDFDGRALTKAQAKKVLGSGYEVTE